MIVHVEKLDHTTMEPDKKGCTLLQKKGYLAVHDKEGVMHRNAKS